jgi:magnesium chelatase family protein
VDGELRPIDGAVSVALMAMARGYRRLIVPESNAPEAAVAVYGVRRLIDAVELLNDSGLFTAQPFAPPAAVEFPDYGTYYADGPALRY